ncbi:MAG TPA: HAMP domain-containing sensor histidine kinase [Ilumatobacter sp.]|nr:HAMP domain-containing sensor histidine kinase [Ilumatobacter sp.]
MTSRSEHNGSGGTAPPQKTVALGHWKGLLGSMRVRIVLAVVVLLALSAGISIILLRNVLLDRLDEEITVALEREAEEFEILAGGLDPRTGEPFGDDFGAMFDLYFAREVPDEGETLLAFIDGRLQHTENSPTAVPAERLDDAIARWLSAGSREEGTLETSAGTARYVALPLTSGGHDALFVAANFPANERDEINDAVRTQAAVQFAMILVAALLGLALAGRVLRPLSRLADTAQTISATDLTRRIPVRGKDEASRIATAFNEMLERIERANAAQRRFLDDASHELRSPMTVIRGHVELLEHETDPHERDAMVKIVTEEIDRMNRIVEDLLLLARSERPGFLSLEPVDIAELTEDVHRRASVLCGRTWLLDARAHVVVRADRQRLTQAMVQYAQNVCEHTPAGVTARIGSQVTGNSVHLWVEDDGPGVAVEQAPHVFDRFVKGAHRPEGSGLGLSIVAAIAEAHGGRARLVTRVVGKGARFEIVLPLTPVAKPEAVAEPTAAMQSV